VKGYCVINPGAAERLEATLADVDDIDAGGCFERLPREVMDGLLGPEGSVRAAELERTDNAEGSDGENIRYLDKLTTDIVAMVTPYLQRPGLDIEVIARTPGILLEAGVEPMDDEVALTHDVCDKYLTTFSRGQVMCVWCLGPETGTLTLKPFDEQANAESIPMQPGTLVLLRADALAHTFESPKKSYCLVSYLLREKLAHRKQHSLRDREEKIPVCQELLSWAQNKILEYKESDEDEKLGIDLPRHWEFVMNHSNFVGQHISIRTAAMRHPSTWVQQEWASALQFGPDTVQEIPMMRFNWEKDYDQNEHGYMYGKHTVKHGSFMEGAELFDNSIFRISRAEAGGMDCGHRLILEAGYEALVRDGLKVGKLINSRGGVYVANPPGLEWGAAEKQLSCGGVCGSGGSVACGRISFTHGMKGPCISTDVEGASSLTAINMCSTNLSKAGRWEPIPFGLVASWNLILGPTFLIHMSASGNASPTGRAHCFDASACGYVRCESSHALVMRSLTEVVDGRLTVKDFGGHLGAFASSYINQSGKRSSLTAPDARGQQECISDAIRMADISPLDVDAVECFSKAKTIEDAVECSATAKAYRPEGLPYMEESPPLALTAYCSNIGHSIEVHGICQVLKICLAAGYGIVHPNLQLKILNPYMDLDICERNANIGIEMVEFRALSSYTGISNRSSAGTNAHAICWGQVPHDRAVAEPVSNMENKILFWPGGGGDLDVDGGYTIMGTFNKWRPQKMESEGKGSYGCTVTLGVNGWESFQVLLDGDADMVLHPGAPRGTKGDRVLGPDNSLRRNCWTIDGRSWLAGEDSTALTEAEGAPSDSPDLGVPGDQYRVRVRVAGKWRTVDWEKLETEGAAGAPPDLGEYQVVASWSDYAPQAMTPDPSQPGVHVVELCLPTAGGSFNIIRDNDYGQAFFPGEEPEVLGPAESEEASSGWFLDGKPGDVFRIEFHRTVETKKVSWKWVRQEAPSQEALALLSAKTFYIVRSGDLPLKMLWNGNHYQFTLVLGSTAKASFTTLGSDRYGNPAGCFYPGTNNASPHEQYEMMGPSEVTAGMVWTIGAHENDDARPGGRYEIRLFLDESGKPVYLDWQPVLSSKGLDELAGRGFLAYGD
jgi:polyketide synthase-associated protein